MSLVGLSPDALDRYPHQFSVEAANGNAYALRAPWRWSRRSLSLTKPFPHSTFPSRRGTAELLEDVRQRFNLAMLFIAPMTFGSQPKFAIASLS